MIVLDENLRDPQIQQMLSAWYPGKVINVKQLRLSTLIKDDAIPSLLRRLSYPTFVTINVRDFWFGKLAHPSYGIVCVEIPQENAIKVASFLRSLLNLTDFRNKTGRMGKVILLTPQIIRYYANNQLSELPWPDAPAPRQIKEPPMPEEASQRPTYRITDLADDDRPRERLAKLGPQALSSAELIAILLRVGVTGENAVQVGQRLLTHFGGIAGLHRASFDEVVAQHGIGPAKVAQLKAAIELGRRLTLESPDERPCINSPADAAALIQYEMSAFEQEHLRVLHLNTRNRVLGMEDVYRGSLNSSQVRVGEVFKSAIRRNASAVIVAHNHPSGDPTPSPDDVAITRAFVQAGKLLDIDVLDHLVIGQGRYVSMKERGLGFG